MSFSSEKSSGGIAPLPSGRDLHPVAMCIGAGHVLVYANPALITRFGRECVGLPAREALLDLPSTAFTLLDAVLQRGRPFARWVSYDGDNWRMTVVPRIDPITGDTYGVSFHLRPRAEERPAD